jgi:ribosome-associated translation inhibitor RaiA
MNILSKNIMDITKKAKEEIEDRLDKIEEFIASKGIGSTYLKKAKKTQRDVNLSILLFGIVTVAGLALWMNGNTKED